MFSETTLVGLVTLSTTAQRMTVVPIHDRAETATVGDELVAEGMEEHERVGNWRTQ